VQIIRMLTHAGSGHPGGSLSVIDILVALVFGRLRHDPKRPDWADRDRIVLSKGHAVPALYTVMARAGYFPEEMLITLRKLGSPLQGHPDRTALPGIEAATGSLGQGLSVSLGMALGLRMAGSPARVYCILGDGEIQEGQVWEAAMEAPKLGQPDHPLDNLTVFVDYNRIQLDDFVSHAPSRTYFFLPCREPWPGASVNARLPNIEVTTADGEPTNATFGFTSMLLDVLRVHGSGGVAGLLAFAERQLLFAELLEEELLRRRTLVAR
jgi:transketolase N-terminal domain/subunit